MAQCQTGAQYSSTGRITVA